MPLNSSLPPAPTETSEATLRTTQGGRGMFERWLRCKIFKGMFSDELAIQCATPGAPATFASVFVPKDFVRGSVDQQGQVKVLFFREGDVAWAVLPTENQLVVPVDETDLTS